MKKLLLLLVFANLISCKDKEPKYPPETDGVPYESSVSKLINNRDFPLKGYSKIEFISYRGDRIMWDTIGSNDKNFFYKDVVINSKLNFDSAFIKERVVLNKKQEKELLNLMVCDTCEPEELPSACYMPRHLILFRDKKNKIIAYNEFCFECIGSRYSKSLDSFQKFCLSDMYKQFEKAGIKFFGDTQEQQKEESKFLDSIQKIRGIK